MDSQINNRGVSATIVSLHWDRIFLELHVKMQCPAALCNAPIVFYAADENGTVKAQFDDAKTDDGFVLRLNITNGGNHRCLPTGNYKIAVCREDVFLTYCAVDPDAVKTLAAADRDFLYAKGNTAYAVTFLALQEQDGRSLVLHIESEKPMGDPDSRNASSLKTRMKKKMLRSVYRHYSNKAKNRANTVLFLSEHGTVLDGNLAAVRDRMIARGLDKEYVICESARSVLRSSPSFQSWIEVTKKIAMSGTIFVDDYAGVLNSLTLHPDTKLIQLWHAGAGFKASGYSRWGHDGALGPMSGYRQIRYGVSGSEKIAHFFSEVWGINTEYVLPTGMPRMDKYLDPAHRAATEKALREQYPITKGKQVILFAPTFRGKNQKDAAYPYSIIDFARLYEFCGDTYVILFKMHPWVSEPVPIPEGMKDKMADASRYPSINDLFYLTDVLITDYSSNIFEFSLMRKPMLFFAFDRDDYFSTRGFHRDYEQSVPGKICSTFEELVAALERNDFDFEKVERYVSDHFDHIDSNASDRVIDWLLLEQIPQQYRDRIAEKEQQVAKWRRLRLPAFSCGLPKQN